MYHMLTPQRQFQFSRGENRHDRYLFRPRARRSAWPILRFPSSAPSLAAITAAGRPASAWGLDLGEAGRDQSRLVRHRQRLDRVPDQQRIDLGPPARAKP